LSRITICEFPRGKTTNKQQNTMDKVFYTMVGIGLLWYVADRIANGKDVFPTTGKKASGPSGSPLDHQVDEANSYGSRQEIASGSGQLILGSDAIVGPLYPGRIMTA
jgi:hypothetical protein